MTKLLIVLLSGSGVCRGFYPRGGGEVIVEATPISLLRNIELLDRGNIIQVTGRAFVAGTLPVKVDDIETALRSLSH